MEEDDNDFQFFLCLLHVSKPTVYFQEDGCIYRNGMVRFIFIGISSLVGRRLFSILGPVKMVECRSIHCFILYNYTG